LSKWIPSTKTNGSVLPHPCPVATVLYGERPRAEIPLVRCAARSSHPGLLARHENVARVYMVTVETPAEYHYTHDHWPRVVNLHAPMEHHG
jgi:hypothetical protein